MSSVKQMNMESLIQCQVEVNTIKKNKTGKWQQGAFLVRVLGTFLRRRLFKRHLSEVKAQPCTDPGEQH